MATARAELKFLRISPRKVRLVADLVRGKRVDHARAILSYTVKGAAPALGKLLKSAVANAEHAASLKRERLDTDEMIVKQILVDDGATMRRFICGPRGRGMRIRKRSSHVQLMIADE